MVGGCILRIKEHDEKPIRYDNVHGDWINLQYVTEAKLNTTSSTEAELVGAYDAMSQIIWTRNFLMAQNFKVSHNILLQENKSDMLLEKNGTASSSKNTWHDNVRYFFIKHRIASGEVELQYCPTEEMIGDFFTKPLQEKNSLYSER
jgi:hypothetical protein